MPANHQQSECDEQLLRAYLDDALSEEQQLLVENHLCKCERCRGLMSDSAADQQWWSRATKYLRGDAWDAELDNTLFSSPVDVDGTRGDNKHPVALRQIQEWLDPTDDPRMLGRFGGYEILGIVGQGGMGVVLKGFEPSLNRYVAIKVLAPLLATSGVARKRFAREAQAAAAVLHDNVIPIHRVDESHDLPYLVMPYVSDIPLQKRIDDEGPLPLVAILRIGEQIASGLAAAHAQGLVHRDIKPANILLEGGVERVRITDFGLARAADDCDLTRTGVIAGTPQYMSPEQARGDSVDGRSDLFSLGSVMYAMSTGRPPFSAETPYGILRCVTDVEPKSIREINPEIPPWLEAMIQKLHAKSVEHRFSSAEEVAELLKDCLAHVQQPTSVPLPEECHPPQKHLHWMVDASPRGRLLQSLARLALFLLTTLVLGCVLIAGREWLFLPAPHEDFPVDTAANTETALPNATPLDAGRHVNDAPVAWDATADEIAHLFRDALPFESQSQQIWSAHSIDPPVPPNTESHVPSQ